MDKLEKILDFVEDHGAAIMLLLLMIVSTSFSILCVCLAINSPGLLCN